VKAGKAKALDMFNKGEGGLEIAIFTCSALTLSTGLRQLIRRTGSEAYGRQRREWLCRWPEMMRTATEGKINEIAYMWPRPSSDTPVQKVTFFTKIDDQICGVGYYK
jgi:hypothetical protein